MICPLTPTRLGLKKFCLTFHLIQNAAARDHMNPDLTSFHWPSIKSRSDFKDLAEALRGSKRASSVITAQAVHPTKALRVLLYCWFQNL